MKLTLRNASQVFLITGLVMVGVSTFVYDYRNHFLNFLMYAVLSVGFTLNLISTFKNKG